MSTEYDTYLENHRNNVRCAMKWFQNNCQYELFDILPDVQLNSAKLAQICNAHDNSKYDPEEYEAYDAYFYGAPKTADEITDGFNKAWLRHIHLNPHHWQYWILFFDDDMPKDKECIEMPGRYILEMICDWWAFSWAKGNLTEIFDWFGEHEYTILLGKHTRAKVNDLINIMKKKLEEQDEHNENI